jgi:EpsD family peptidyl-prolyl cis-trans isomerase
MKKAIWFPVVVALAIVVGGCGRDAPKKAATQVAAKVNGDEITVHEVNAVLSKAPNLPPEAAPTAKREVLTRLVDQQLAVEQAIAKKLDRSPQVLQAVELARSEILARAYTDSLVRALPKPSEEEVKKYYNEHPALFAKRRIYSLEEVAIVSNDDLSAELDEQIAKGRTMGDLVKWLQSKGARLAPNHGTRPAEQLPMSMLPVLESLKDGQIRLFKMPTGLTLVRLIASRTAPVDEATAAPRISQFLFNRAATEALAADRKALKAAAKIEYLGEFAEDLGTAQAKAKAEAEARAKAAADAKAHAQAEAQERAESATKARQAAEARAKEQAQAKTEQRKSAPLPQETLQKGLSGLR